MVLHIHHESDSKGTLATPMDVAVPLLELSGDAYTPHSLVPSSLSQHLYVANTQNSVLKSSSWRFVAVKHGLSGRSR